MDFYKYLDQDFSSQHFLFTYILCVKIGFKMGKMCGKFKFVLKKVQKVQKVSTKVKKSQKVLTNVKNLDSLDLS